MQMKSSPQRNFYFRKWKYQTFGKYLSKRGEPDVKPSKNIRFVRRLHEKTDTRRIHRFADFPSAQVPVTDAAREAVHRMRRTRLTRLPLLEAPGQSPGTPAQETRPEAPLLQHLELSFGVTGHLTLVHIQADSWFSLLFLFGG